MVKESKETKEQTAVAVVPDRRSTAIVGTIQERLLAFEQIASHLCQLQLNGWKTVSMCKAACWLADAAGLHPATFMQNNYCMEIQGKLMVEPKWEFIVGVLESRIPGFRFKVLVETDSEAKVEMSKPPYGEGFTHVVGYTIEDARRQGLTSRGNMWSANTREGCLKQAIKRCGKRIGGAALMDLPVDGYEVALNGEHGQPTSSPTAAIDAAVAKVTGQGRGVEVEFTEEPEGANVGDAPSPPTTDSPRVRLHAAITKHYGPLSKQDAAAKVNELYNAMMKEETGVDPKMAFKAGEVGPIEAERLIHYLSEKGAALNPDRGSGPMAGESGPAADPAALDSDDVPPSEETWKPETQVQEAYDALMGTVLRARKLFSPRQFIQEAPPKSGKFWFVDANTFQQVGDKASVKIQVAGEVVAPVAKLEALNKVLAAAVDAKERGGKP